MLNTKFFAFLRTLDKKELSDFDKFLNANYAKQEIILKVFAYLKRFHPEFDSATKLEAAYAYEKIFGESIDADKYNRSKLFNALSDLLACLKSFLLYQKATDDSTESKLLWANILLGRGIENEFSKEVVKLKTEAEAITPASISDFLNKLTISYLYYYRGINKKLESDNAALQDCINHLEAFYAFIRLKLACEVKTRDKLLPQERAVGLSFESNEIIKPVSANALDANPLLSAYYELCRLIEDSDVEHYDKTEKLLIDNIKNISEEDQHILVSYLQNYAADRNRLSGGFLQRVFAIQRFAAKEKVFQLKGALSPSQFNNIITVACQCGEFEWAKWFIETHTEFLAKDMQADTRAMSLAIIAFDEGRFGDVLELLRDVNFTDVHFAIRTKSLVVRSHCELKAPYELIYASCLAFERYLKRNKKLKGATVEGVSNFVNLLKKLIRKTDKAALTKEIEAKQPIYFREWLLVQVDSYYSE